MNMPVDFSAYDGGLMRSGTVTSMRIRLLYGDGTDNVLTRTKNGDAEMLKFECIVLEGEYAKRKLFCNWIVNGTTEGQKSIAERYNNNLKRIIASYKYLDINDRSPETIAKYKVEYRDFDGMTFLAEIGIEPGKEGYDDKNIIQRVVTKDMPQWNGRPPFPQDQGGGSPTPPSPPAPPIKPSWAQ
jgi:hypothetical protein